MLRVTKTEQEATTTLKLEGRLADVWVAECLAAWKAVTPSLMEKKLLVDIRNLTFVDGKGADLLAAMYKQHHARFVTGSPLTQHFANQAMLTGTKTGHGF